jgi:DNA-binding MarR family transcriptional regulator
MPRKRLVSWRAKLRPSQVRLIRKLYFEGENGQCWTQGELAERFKVSRTALSFLLRGITYRSVQ